MLPDINRTHLNKQPHLRRALSQCFIVFVFALHAGVLSSCVSFKKERPMPTLFLIGDSTVKNGKGKGDSGLWGWGDFLGLYFKTDQINIQNDALGGTSSRTYRSMGLWDKVLAQLKPGDYVMLQFGHNDSSPVNDTLRARGTIRGNGEEKEEIINLLTQKQEVVHSYGWYIRSFISDIKAKGATAIVLSPVPRNSWTDGKVKRNEQDYGKWAKEAALQQGAWYIDLNSIIAAQYDTEGEGKVRAAYFNSTDHTHTIEAGAKVNAAAVARGIQQSKKLSLKKYVAKQKVKRGSS